MNPDTNTPINLPAALVARLERAAEDQGMTPAELLEGWLEREEKERSWQALVQRGRQRGALSPDADEEAINALVNAGIEESRRERRARWWRSSLPVPTSTSPRSTTAASLFICLSRPAQE